MLLQRGYAPLHTPTINILCQHLSLARKFHRSTGNRPLFGLFSAFQSYIQGLFQAPRGTQLRMSEGMETDSQALNHLLTEASVDWKGLTGEIARQADALLGGDDSALILDESAFAKKGQ
ncbi:transposase, partial [Thiolapillus sp.]|uniref:transposase n=1 Tax=Thiolapillus sp. TaxID=2017437 RepID=UPI003AF81703